MLLKNKIIIAFSILLSVVMFGCDNQMPIGFGFSTKVVASVNGEIIEIADIPYTIRKKGEEEIPIQEKKTDSDANFIGHAGVAFFGAEPPVALDYQYIVVDNIEELAIAQENGESPYYLRINDSSCEGYDTNYKTDVIVECKGFEPDNICDITKE